MRKALVVGINYYAHMNSLHGCVDDAHRVRTVLETDGMGEHNFDVRLLTGTGPTDVVDRGHLKDAVRDLFSTDDEIALFYFAGHGHIETAGGYLLGSDSRRGDDGLALADVMAYANGSTARNRIIVLDSCFSGIAGDSPIAPQAVAELKEGTTILTASTKDQYAKENDEGGVFSNLFVDALHGATANLVGEVTPGSVYAHIDQSLSRWDQRPIFKTNVKSFVCLRKVPPRVEHAELRRIAELFPRPGYEFPLDPSFEPEMLGRKPGMPDPNPENVRTFRQLQRYFRVNLVVPVGASEPFMWHAAMEEKACKLTALGEHYRRLVEDKRI